jgi:hypothetical protein
MENEIQLISDDDGLAVIGESTAVERFLASEGLASRDLELPRLTRALGAGAAAAQAGSEIAANAGRWVKLTPESAAKVKTLGLMPSKTPGVSHAMIGKPGNVKSWLQISTGPGSLASNPALLSGAAGIMTQLAMQQAMDEITDYLATIDAKLDDVLRAQKDAVVASMIGVGFDIEEAMTLRKHVGRVNEVTWSKVQSSSATIARTQSYALLQLDALAEKLEGNARISDLLQAAKDAEAKTQEWLAVLARCFQLQDAIAVLELDRVRETAPDDLDGHRLGLKAARKDRLDSISRSTDRLLLRMAAAAASANLKVLLNPSQSPAVVKSNAHVAAVVYDFHERLGIKNGRGELATRRWVEAVADVRDKAREAGSERVDAAQRLGGEARDRARSMKGKLSTGVAKRALRRRTEDDQLNDER